MCDEHYFVKYSPYSIWIWGIFYIIVAVPHNIVMDLNNVKMLIVDLQILHNF